MRAATMLIAFYVFIFISLFLTHVQDAEAYRQNCISKKKFKGECGENGLKVCMEDFKKKPLKCIKCLDYKPLEIHHCTCRFC
uniref:SCR protein n=1 Tax=Arabidopsis halleri TaxID=81970 RepID=I4IY60_ARAHA|nr:SCRp [Arabidopsis halleri]CCI61490.1 SCR [Arabidopsis halleri]CCI61491.1 SCR [Arabidopsis halleri]